jgi:hypothetical protein
MLQISVPSAADLPKVGLGQPDCTVETPTSSATLHDVADVQKTYLPRRAEENRLAPQQYYYAASRSGIVPG